MPHFEASEGVSAEKLRGLDPSNNEFNELVRWLVIEGERFLALQSILSPKSQGWGLKARAEELNL